MHTPERTLVGASPEVHVRMSGNTVVMNPISGTYRYPTGGPDLSDLLRFLADRKETDELSMVLDEELKMMAVVANSTSPVARMTTQAGRRATDPAVAAGGKAPPCVEDAMPATLTTARGPTPPPGVVGLVRCADARTLGAGRRRIRNPVSRH